MHWSIMKIEKIAVLLIFAVLCGLAAKETLSVTFDKAQTLDIAGRKVKVDGTFTEDGCLVIGTKGLAIPAAALVGDDRGTVLFQCRFMEEQKHEPVMRTMLHLRTANRTTMGFQYFAAMSANFRLYNGEKSYLHPFPHLETGRMYMFGMTWDGNTVRLYQDGMQIAENSQVLSLKDIVRSIFIGPYRDGWFAPSGWEDSYHIRSLRVYDTALTPEEIAKIFNIDFKPLQEEMPFSITIPAVPSDMKAPDMDGQVQDKVWQYGASMPRLIRGLKPQFSGEIPPHDFKLLYDRDNLYLGFTSIFPGGSNIVEGNLRTPGLEPEAWGTESFEFYVQTDNLYRFAGNVAGGYCEGLPNTPEWNGKWTYRTHRSMKIDDRVHWHGEVAIPWKTIGLQGPPAKPIKINFCRSWKIESMGAFTSMNLQGGGYGPEALFTASFAPKGTASLQILEQNDPNCGEYEQKIRVSSTSAGTVTYELSVGKLDGSSRLIPLAVKSWKMKAGEVLEDKLMASITYPDFDCLVYTLKHGGRIVMNEIIPFKLDDNFFDLEGLFMQGRIRILLKPVMMRNKLGASFTGRINLMDPAGKVLASIPSNAENPELPFDRAWAGGEYKVALVDGEGRICAEKHIAYPGRREWEDMKFPTDIILPPFAPMESRAGKGSLESRLSLRRYSWNNSFLPVQIESLDEGLFARPAELLVNGQPVAADSFAVGMNKPHRAEFAVRGGIAESKSWLEYDGVQWNDLSLSKVPAGASVALRFTFDSRFAKYLHTSSSTGWGAKITRAVPEGETIVPFFPSLWLGNEEKGFCFFAESNGNWNVPAKRTFAIRKSGGMTTLTVYIMDKMKGGESVCIGFGLLGTPIRPFAKNYPLDTMGWTFAARMNRQGRRPTCYTSIMSSRPGLPTGDFGSYYADLDDAGGRARAEAYRAELEWCKGTNLRPYPYLCGRYISIKYPELQAYKAEWTFKPEIALGGTNGDDLVYDCCPASTANEYIAHKIYGLLKRFPDMKGVYFDFGNVPHCSNSEHGCSGGIPILAQREFYRRVAYVQTLVGINEPITVLHNTDSNLLPTYTFASHLLNGEHVRQSSSTYLHNKKDILDTYGIEMFASELSSLPFGITNSVYMPLDTLMKKYGGDEGTEEYQFRLGKAEYAATLIHNTIICFWRNHFGMADKLVRIYDRFGVDRAKFIGYWREPVKVVGGKDIYVSCYVKDGKVLAVVGHVSKSHDNQTFELKFDWDKLGIKNAPVKALDTMSAPDPEYKELYELRRKNRIDISRATLDLGSFGSKILDFKGDTLKMSLEYHSFAIIELSR